MSASRVAPLLGALWALWALPSTAADFQVTNLADSNPPPAGSLRAAVQAANASPGPDRILFAIDGTVALAAGEIVITDAVEIRGRGRSANQIDGLDASRIFRIDGDINNVGAVNVTMRALTLTHGNSGIDGGGAVAVLDFAKARIEDCVVWNSRTNASGGAVYAYQSQLDVVASTLTDNHADDVGGGIAAEESELLVDRSTLRANASSFGGAIGATGVTTAVHLFGSRIESNTSANLGGGLALTISAVDISGVTLSGNSADFAGGGAYLLGTATGSLVIQNSTVSGNVVNHDGGRGSGVALSEGTLWLRNSTVAYNRAPNAANNDATLGGGVYVAEGGHTVNLVSTLVADNTRGAFNVPSEIARGIGIEGTLVSTINASHSLFRNVPEPGVLNGTDVADVIGADPLLLPLADNGGPTPTHALGTGSPACERGANPSGLATDQRGSGFSRGYGAVDIGAYEYRGDTIFFGDFERHDPALFGCA